jgi:hypothetical protein
MTASLLTAVVVRETPHHTKPPVGPTEAEVTAALPYEVQILLPGGLCDNIQAAFMDEAARFINVPIENREAVKERIEDYRNWLQRKGCG